MKVVTFWLHATGYLVSSGDRYKWGEAKQHAATMEIVGNCSHRMVKEWMLDRIAHENFDYQS